jgi:DNA-binding MarR family transcriptional regulator
VIADGAGTRVSLLETVELRAWVLLLRVHASLTRQFSAALVAEHGLTLNDYDVLVQLSRAAGQRLRRVDLAQQVLLTPSGITRLLEGLERAGWVERAECPSDGRVAYAQLTAAGEAKLREASETHLEAVSALLGDRLTSGQLTTLVELLARLPASGDDACSS